MERGLYIAATGMLANLVRQDAIASNLANVNTVGYKPDRVVNETFSDMFLTNLKTGKDVGNLNLGTRVSAVVTDFAQGGLRNTGQATDVAIEGDGFFKVQTGQGQGYTRNGSLMVDKDGVLVTSAGDQVLSTNGASIKVGSGNPIIKSDGRVFDATGALRGQMAIVGLDLNTAQKLGDNMWTGTETGTPASTYIQQGFLEMSATNSIREMVDMITTMRSYESAQRAMTSIDGTLEKAVNSVGAVG